MEYMSTCEDSKYDLAIVDPPYFNGPNLSGYYGKGYSNLGVKRAKYYKDCKYWDMPTLDYFNKLLRVSRNQIIWGANYYDFIGKPFKTPRRNKINNFIKDNPKGWIIWDKCNGNSTFNDYELAKTSFNEVDTVIFKFMWSGMMQGKGISNGHIQQGDKSLNEKRIHPTQKPIYLYKWIIKEYAKKKYKLLDTHGGSFNHAIAAYDMGFDLDIIEIDKDYFKSGKNRLNNHMKKGDLIWNQ